MDLFWFELCPTIFAILLIRPSVTNDSDFVILYANYSSLNELIFNFSWIFPAVARFIRRCTSFWSGNWKQWYQYVLIFWLNMHFSSSKNAFVSHVLTEFNNIILHILLQMRNLCCILITRYVCSDLSHLKEFIFKLWMLFLVLFIVVRCCLLLLCLRKRWAKNGIVKTKNMKYRRHSPIIYEVKLPRNLFECIFIFHCSFNISIDLNNLRNRMPIFLIQMTVDVFIVHIHILTSVK